MSTNSSTENREELTRIIDSVLTLAKQLGATEAEADVGVGSGLSANVRKGEIDKLEYERDKGLGITVYIDGQKGNSSTSDFSEAAIKTSVEAAIGIAKHASRDEFAGLVEKELMATDFPDLDLYHPWDISPEAAIDLAIETEQLAFDEAARCLNCDVQTVFSESLCIECDSCMDICPTNCINFIENGEEEDLRKRLIVPAENQDQDLLVSEDLRTGRVMVKAEDVCLHCGLCAERCATSAWDMQKFLYREAQAGKSCAK